MQVRPLSTGRVRPKRAQHGVRRYLPGGWSEATKPVDVFLIDHPDGLLLFDAGQTARAAERGYFPWWHPYLRLARFELGPQDEIGAQVDPATVRWLVLSHLHTDHVGGLEPFRAAEVLVSRTEWGRARGLAGRLRGYLPQHWPPGLEPRLVDFDGPPVGPFAGSHDVAGDGRLILVPTPGHTPGHMALLARSRNQVAGPGWMLGGDMDLDREVAAFCESEGLTFLGAHG
jgi:glyoxylase-like metal-dependent hydrolase (beta-lactamase superfamily II)